MVRFIGGIAFVLLSSLSGFSQDVSGYELHKGTHRVAFNLLDFSGYNVNLQYNYFLTERWGLVGYMAHGLRGEGIDEFPAHENLRIDLGLRYELLTHQNVFVQVAYSQVISTAWYREDAWIEVERDGLLYYELHNVTFSEHINQSGLSIYVGKTWNRNQRLFFELMTGIGFRDSNASDNSEIRSLNDQFHSGFSGTLFRAQFSVGVNLN